MCRIKRKGKKIGFRAVCPRIIINNLNTKFMDANYFILVNERKKEIYYITENQARAQHAAKYLYKRYDKHIICKKVYLSESDLKKYDEIVYKEKKK